MALDREQFVTLKLAEECIEVAKRATKQMQFGAEERLEDGPTNHERLMLEVFDLLAHIEFYCEHRQIPTPFKSGDDLAAHTRVKRLKVMHYLSRSHELGKVE